MRVSAAGTPRITMVARSVSEESMLKPRLAKCFSEPRGKFLIDAVEPAIGKDGDDIACGKLRRDRADDGIDVGVQFGARAAGVERAHHVFRMQTLLLGNALLLIHAGEDDAVGIAQALDEVAFEHLAPQRV